MQNEATRRGSAERMSASIGFQLRQHWHDIKRGRPGRRFRDRFEKSRRATGKKAGPGRRALFLAVGVAALAIGVVLVVIPGPAIPFLFLGGALLATESRIIAGFMDWAEVRLRAVAGWVGLRWRRLPKAVRAVLLVLGAGASAASAYFLFQWMRG